MQLIHQGKARAPETRFVSFDIETVPMAAEILEPQVPEFDPSEVKVGNLKDPALVAAKIEAAAARHKSQFMADAALSALTGQVAAIGVKSWYSGKFTEPESVNSMVSPTVPVTPENEAAIINSFWETWDLAGKGSRTVFVGHNILDFDLPFLVLRSRLLGLKVPSDLVRFVGHKYSFSLRFVDTRQLFALGRNVRDLKTSLDHLAGLMGIGKKYGNGSQFADLLRDNPAMARAYLERDVDLTAQVALRLGIEDLHGFDNG